MKLFARIFALTLVATGAFASTQIANSQKTMVTANTSAMPVPVCPPDDPNACGAGN